MQGQDLHLLVQVLATFPSQQQLPSFTAQETEAPV